MITKGVRRNWIIGSDDRDNRVTGLSTYSSSHGHTSLILLSRFSRGSVWAAWDRSSCWASGSQIGTTCDSSCDSWVVAVSSAGNNDASVPASTRGSSHLLSSTTISSAPLAVQLSLTSSSAFSIVELSLGKSPTIALMLIKGAFALVLVKHSSFDRNFRRLFYRI